MKPTSDVLSADRPSRFIVGARSLFGRFRRVGLVPLVALALVIAFVGCAVFADVLAPYSPFEGSLSNRLLPPAWVEGGSSQHLLGTDTIGRDLLSRIIAGSRASFTVAILALFLGGVVGTLVGLIAGYFSGGLVDIVLMRLVDVALSIPLILFALLFVVLTGPTLANVVLATGLVLWARFSRVIRGEVLSLRERDYVYLAKVAGASNARIMMRHLVPNFFNTFVVLATLQMGFVILVEASLSFLGAGIPPPAPAWGSMVADGRGYVLTAPWLSLIPGLAIMAVVLAFNLVGDWLRDVLDPRLT